MKSVNDNSTRKRPAYPNRRGNALSLIRIVAKGAEKLKSVAIALRSSEILHRFEGAGTRWSVL